MEMSGTRFIQLNKTRPRHFHRLTCCVTQQQLVGLLAVFCLLGTNEAGSKMHERERS